MTNEERKSEVELCSKQIEEAKQRIAEIRKDCPHESTREGFWQWREGSIRNAIVCNWCHGLIKLTD